MVMLEGWDSEGVVHTTDQNRDSRPVSGAVNPINPFTPRVINFKLPLQPHQKYNIPQYGELGFSYLTQMKDEYTTNSH